MNYLRGYSAFREDPEWTSKVGTAALLMLLSACIPVLPQLVVVGWTSLIARRALQGNPALPRLEFNMDYMGKLIGIGFKPFLAQILWSIPLIVLAVPTFCGLYFALIFGFIDASRSNEPPLALFLCFAAAMIVWLPLVIAVSVPMMIARVRTELSDDLKAGTNFGEVIATTKLVLERNLDRCLGERARCHPSCARRLSRLFCRRLRCSRSDFDCPVLSTQ